MKHVIAVPVLTLVMFVVGCAQKHQVKVTYLSDPPGGTLYKQNGDYRGPCPMALWYDLDKEALARGYLDAKGMVVRWRSGPQKKSNELIRITVNGTERHVIFLQPRDERVAADTVNSVEGKTPEKKEAEPQGVGKLKSVETERTEELSAPNSNEAQRQDVGKLNSVETERAEEASAPNSNEPAVPVKPLKKTPSDRVLTLSEQQLVLLDWHSPNRRGAHVEGKRAVAGPGLEFDIVFPNNSPGSCSLSFVSTGAGGRGSLVGTDVRSYDSFALKLTLVSINGQTEPTPNQTLVAGAVFGPTAEGRLTGYKPVALSLAASEKTVMAKTPFSTDGIYEIGFHIHALNYEAWDVLGSRIVLRVEPAEEGRVWAFSSSKR